jgi:hypothetical protein
MSLTQFIHLGGYGRKAHHRRSGPWTIRDILGEASRMPQNSPHISHPIEPALLFGRNLAAVHQRALQLSVLAKDRVGRRLRSDGVVLGAGVVTYPVPVASMGGFESDPDVYSHWRTLTLEWLQREHGESLVAVVEHEDEEMLHLHFFTLPKIDRNTGRLDFSQAHPGRAALNTAADQKVCKAAQSAAYTQAMIDYQSRFFAAVSQRFGHSRVGPRRQRISRALHKVNRQAEQYIERVRAALELEYWSSKSEAETDAGVRRVREAHIVAASAARERRLNVEIANLKAILRENGIEARFQRDNLDIPTFSSLIAPMPGNRNRLIDDWNADIAEIPVPTPDEDEVNDAWTSRASLGP